MPWSSLISQYGSTETFFYADESDLFQDDKTSIHGAQWDWINDEGE